ncbi:PREDICTED: uncharacterized protein LOC108615788 [Drosophila arizonae]|uniref:Uncharacterized protein LOC108615788 n=1 Tax=Drosophila arizonae TaxID=7263 RepID=A0ABM1PFR3_DROAR|nr:PREDICTED: uncharacterized protein LOC108615788 [Drosophila arizonae]
MGRWRSYLKATCHMRKRQCNMAKHTEDKQQQQEDHKEKQEQDEAIDWWMEVCKESAIHGMPYLARKDLHSLERIFWLAMIIASTYYAVNSCIAQWQRYKDNPIIYEYEYMFALRSFPYAGATVCTHYYQLPSSITHKLLVDIWESDSSEISETGIDDESMQYYAKFLHVLHRLQYDNLETLIPYENDTTLQNLPYVRILRKLLKNTVPKQQEVPELVSSLTEMGLCLTTSQLASFGFILQKHVEQV